MANYTAADIKALRERTGAGMMDVKKALDEANGDAEKAIEIIRIKGLKGATKREGRSTAEGLVAAKVANGVGVMIEVNCETDFVAKADKFIQLADKVLAVAVESGAADLETLLATERRRQAAVRGRHRRGRRSGREGCCPPHLPHRGRHGRRLPAQDLQGSPGPGRRPVRC